MTPETDTEIVHAFVDYLLEQYDVEWVLENISAEFPAAYKTFRELYNI